MIRRRRTRRHRRNRLIRRTLAFFFLLALAAGVSSVALRYLSPSVFRVSKSSEPSREAAESSRARLVEAQQAALLNLEGRPVYRYSVVPGGVKDVQELKWAADHDPVVAQHYAGFDYDHARVVRLALARTAYVSYRIGNKVYWMRHRVTLPAGETVITDGKIMVRTRCGNRVEDVCPQYYLSPEPRDLYGEYTPLPIPPPLTNPPGTYISTLFPHFPEGGLEPAPPLSLYDPFGPGTYLPLSPPQLPSGVCGPVQKKGKGTGTGESGGTGKKKNPGNPCGGGGGGGEVPEPGTWLLTASGLALICWVARKRLVRTWHPTAHV